jgi:hypothetical protein
MYLDSQSDITECAFLKDFLLLSCASIRVRHSFFGDGVKLDLSLARRISEKTITRKRFFNVV